MKKYLIVFLLGLVGNLIGQEFQSIVVIDASSLGAQDQSIFQQMKRDIEEYVNRNVWTEDAYQPHERIRLKINIQITSGSTVTGSYGASAVIQGVRPVYGVDYETIVFSFADKNFDFQYLPGQDMSFTQNIYTNHLTALLQFYSYISLGFDYDSFSSLGGTVFFEKARNLLNVVPQNVNNGWLESQNVNNRWHFINNITSPQALGLRKEYYKYHRLGLDVFNKNIPKTHEVVIGFLNEALKLRGLTPSNIYLESVFMAKNDELISIFKPAPKEVKQTVFDFMQKIDPTNIDKFKVLLNN